MNLVLQGEFYGEGKVKEQRQGTADASFHPFSANLVNTMIDDGRHDTYNLIVRNNSYMHQQLRPCADLVEVFAYSSTFPGSKDE
ncbi:hypothetical protein SCA6_011941 [Theobroma cacao]